MDFYAALYPDADRKKLRRAAWRQFKSFTTVFIDRFLIENGRHDQFKIENDGLETIVNTVKQGHGGILWMSHLGNWEVAVHCLKKYDVPITLVLGQYADERIEAIQREQLTVGNIKIITMKEGGDFGAVELVNALRNGELIAISGDRLFDDEQRSTNVKFFGKNCQVPIGAYVLSAITGAEIIPIYGFRQGTLSYRFVAATPLKVQFKTRSERQTEISRVAQACFYQLESKVKDYPDQWYNFFNYWS